MRTRQQATRANVVSCLINSLRDRAFHWGRVAFRPRVTLAVLRELAPLVQKKWRTLERFQESQRAAVTYFIGDGRES